MLLKFIIFFLTLFFYVLTCKDEDNNTVDWFILYKLPQHSKDNNHLIRSGEAYIYITSKDVLNGWKLSNVSINRTDSMPGLILQDIYKNPDMYILYNDEPPSHKKNDRKGHTKGVLISNNSNGLWLIHSVPHYPPESSYYYPDSGLRYGQSFLCISLDLSNLNQVGQQLQYNEPNIYKSRISDALKNKLPFINNVINDKVVQSPPWNHLKALCSVDGEQFLSFAKSRNFGKDVYNDWVTTVLESNLLVETWLNGPGRLPSDCSKIYSVYNIKELHLPFEEKNFLSSTDHSKWAITYSKDNLKYWLCIGDINREEPQEHRGGGLVCLKNTNLWSLYNNSVVDFESCKI